MKEDSESHNHSDNLKSFQRKGHLLYTAFNVHYTVWKSSPEAASIRICNKADLLTMHASKTVNVKGVQQSTTSHTSVHKLNKKWFQQVQPIMSSETGDTERHFSAHSWPHVSQKSQVLSQLLAAFLLM